jgi:hypothetical protein
MMQRAYLIAAALAMANCIGLAGCNSSTSTIIQAPVSNISGDYSGTMDDAAVGAGNATATLAQHGSAAGGAITDVEGGGTITAQLSVTISSTNAVSGAMVVDYGGGTTCTFSTTGTYDPSTSVLNGSYTAVTNCSGDTGTFMLTQSCHDTITGSEVRTLGTPKC